MDIGRNFLQNLSARKRLDANTWGTMGVGFGFAIAAQAVDPKQKVVVVQGDSAFGFSAMEIETAARYKMPLKIIIINNNGIGTGTEELDEDDNSLTIAPGYLNPKNNYELIANAFGCKGAQVKTHDELAKTLKVMLTDNNLWVLNVRIDPNASRKPQKFNWFDRDYDEKKDVP